MVAHVKYMDTKVNSKMHKRRAKLVEHLLKELNPQHYLSTLQQLSFQLGEIYNQIFDIKYAQLEQLPVIPPQKAKKMNAL